MRLAIGIVAMVALFGGMIAELRITAGNWYDVLFILGFSGICGAVGGLVFLTVWGLGL